MIKMTEFKMTAIFKMASTQAKNMIIKTMISAVVRTLW